MKFCKLSDHNKGRNFRRWRNC